MINSEEKLLHLCKKNIQIDRQKDKDNLKIENIDFYKLNHSPLPLALCTLPFDFFNKNLH